MWWAQVSRAGERRRFSLRTRDRAIAEQLRNKAEAEIRGVAAAEPATWEQLGREFLAGPGAELAASSLKKYRFVLGRFGAYLRETGVEDVSLVTPIITAGYGPWRQQDFHPTKRNHVSSEGLKSDHRILTAYFRTPRR